MGQLFNMIMFEKRKYDQKNPVKSYNDSEEQFKIYSFRLFTLKIINDQKFSLIFTKCYLPHIIFHKLLRKTQELSEIKDPQKLDV